MKSSASLPSLTIGLIWLTTLAPSVLAQTPSRSSEPIPLAELGAKAGAQYNGDGLSVVPTPEGARLRCVFQKLEGQVSCEGLWLTSTVEPQTGEKFRVAARTVGREGALIALPPHGAVTVADKLARCVRPGLTEEYSVSVDGVRQDFIVTQRPAGNGPLRVELNVTGAKAEALVNGARLVVAGSGRRIDYSRLRVMDAGGNTLTARLEVTTGARLAVLVEDAAAAYPVRIDPTFSDADWVSLNPGIPGANYIVHAVVADGHGNVYVGGAFSFIGAVPANGIAKWDGSAWSALGSGVVPGFNGGVFALAVSDTSLYVGGSFTTAGGVVANNIAKWDGSGWSALGSGMGGGGNYHDVLALAVSGTNLYAGGRFTKAGGMEAYYIAKWNGISWSALGSGIGGLGLNGTSVRTLAVSGTNLYAGGYFTMAGGVSANCVAKWDGSAWSALGSGVFGMNGTAVLALALSGTNLYVGGAFDQAGGVTAVGIAKWDGSAWSALRQWQTGQYSPYVTALALSGTNLYVAAVEWPSVSISKWDGSFWSTLVYDMGGGVNALAINGVALYVGGGFITAGGVLANYIARWDGASWSALGSGIGNPGLYNAFVQALAVSGTNLYGGGWLTMAGGGSANNIAKWNGTAWSALGSGMAYGGNYAPVSALAVSGTDLYAGGWFTTAGGGPANYIAKWNGTSWSALGSGMDNSVSALAVSGTDLYAGGSFTTAGGVAVSNVGKWNGTSWSALGSGMDNSVYALAVSGTDLYAGGSFTTAGGVAVSNVGKWNGTSWSALGSGMDNSVSALAVSGTDLYAGGSFTTAGGVAANYVAKWNGSAWSALGLGLGGSVNALAVSGTDLYAGLGISPGGMAANYIAKWNGSAWSALGSGMNSSVLALVVDGAGHLFVGGDFFLAGTNASPYIAQANIGASVAAGRFRNAVCSPATGFSCVFSEATLGHEYRIQTSPSLAVGSWTDFTNFSYTGPILFKDTSAVGVPKRFYRAVTP